jgi:hypothetical protein
VLGIANRLSQVSSTLAGTQGPVAARSEGTASALLTATRQCGSAIGVAILSATLVAVRGGTSHRTGVAMFVPAGFALAGLLATRVVPPGPPDRRRRSRSTCSAIARAGSRDNRLTRPRPTAPHQLAAGSRRAGLL